MLSNRSHRRAAFTLLEVSIVVVIIFLLILALIPAFRGAKSEKRYPVLPPATPTPTKASDAVPISGLKKLALPEPSAPGTAPLPPATPTPAPEGAPAPEPQ